MSFFNGFMSKCAQLGITNTTALNLFKVAMINPSIIGIDATKMSPEEYYKATGQLLNKGGGTKVPLKPATKQATLMELSEKYRTPELEKYFQKSAECGFDTHTAVTALLEKLELNKKGGYTYKYNFQDPFVALADCMLQIGG